MKILIIGGGGREHALAWKIEQSPMLEKLYIAPGNAGTASIGQNINLDINDFGNIRDFVLQKAITLVIVGPEAPLVNGLKDFFDSDATLSHIPVFGPGMEGARLEGSKERAKQFMKKHHIPTAGYQAFGKDELEKALSYLETIPPPYVLKADGLAGGKGVVICEDIKQAAGEVTAMLRDAKFGEASSKVVIEEFMKGIELSVFVITDGTTYRMLPAAKDYKRVGEEDTGLNTGGMGSVSPVPFVDETFMKKVEEQIIKPTIEGLKKEHVDYTGFIFFGLMNMDNNPYVVEYNARMGDPEAESVIPRIRSDLLELIDAATKGKLREKSVDIDQRYSTSVMLVSGGYPGKYAKGIGIDGLEKVSDSIIFHAGTKNDNNQTVTSGGRVIAVTGMDDSMEAALENAYRACQTINFEGKYYRKDIGYDLIKYMK